MDLEALSESQRNSRQCRCIVTYIKNVLGTTHLVAKSQIDNQNDKIAPFPLVNLVSYRSISILRGDSSGTLRQKYISTKSEESRTCWEGHSSWDKNSRSSLMKFARQLQNITFTVSSVFSNYRVFPVLDATKNHGLFTDARNQKSWIENFITKIN